MKFVVLLKWSNQMIFCLELSELSLGTKKFKKSKLALITNPTVWRRLKE